MSSRSSTLELQLDRMNPMARHYLALGLAFVVQSALRSFCITSDYVFGKDLRENLAPVERENISYSYILGTRLLDLILAIYVWRREAGGHRARVDAPLLGVALSLLSKAPLYLLLSHYFLLSFKTLGQILITDVFASAVALYIIGRIEPKQTAFFERNELVPRNKEEQRSKLEMVGYALGLSTFANALYSFIAERLYMQELIRNNVLEHSIPAYLSSLKPAFAEAIAHPTIAIPVLRSAISPMSMPEHILHALPLSIIALVMSSVYLPQKSPASLAFLLFVLTAPTNALSVFNILPVNVEASTAIGLENGFKAAVVGYIVSWVTEDWRRAASPNPNLAADGSYGTAANDGAAILKEVKQSETVIVGKDSITFRELVDTEVSGEEGEGEIEEVEVL